MKSPPNIVFIVIDSARWDHFSVYHYEKATTPFLESIADQFLIYENANAPAAWTRPAISSIFTSLYPQQYGFFEGKFPEETVLLTEILRASGYKVYVLSNNPYMSPASGFARGTDRFYFVQPRRLPHQLHPMVLVRFLPKLVRQCLDRSATYKVLPQMINAQAIRIIRHLARSGSPFFIYMHHDAHHPYLSERKVLRRFLNGASEEDIRLVDSVQKSGNMYWFNRESLSREKRQCYYRILRAMHDASIYRNDVLISQTMRELRRLGIYDKTMIIITADHGEFLGERDMISHGLYLYEESVHVPLMIKYPRDVGLVGRTQRLVSTIDLMPTILSLLGKEVYDYVPQAQGRSLLEDCEHEFVISQRSNFSEGIDFWRRRYPDHSFEKYDMGNLICFKSRKKKFVWSSKGKHALFDLEVDPSETQNIYDHSKHADYLERAETWIRTVPKVSGIIPEQFDEAIRRHLRGLGYIE